jgi:hypothetical protein
MNSMNESDFPIEGSFPVEFDGWKLEKKHLKIIYDLARDQGRDPYEYLGSLMEWMRQEGYGPRK